MKATNLRLNWYMVPVAIFWGVLVWQRLGALATLAGFVLGGVLIALSLFLSSRKQR